MNFNKKLETGKSSRTLFKFLEISKKYLLLNFWNHEFCAKSNGKLLFLINETFLKMIKKKEKKMGKRN
jgi:hypothetical protein